jgi:transcription-repair coupling factor (superfamily II helicase)
VDAKVKSPAELLRAGKPLTLSQVADGAEGLVLADLARAIAAKKDAPAISLAVICRDGQRLAQLSRALAFFGPDILTMEFPAWDCLPYDRVSPNASVVAQRMTALSRLARVKGRDKPSALLTTVNAALQRVPSRDFVATHALSVAPGNVIGMAGIVEWLELNGFARASTVREPATMPCAAASSICSPREWTCRCGSTFSETRWRRSAPSTRRHNGARANCAASIWCRSRNSN